MRFPKRVLLIGSLVGFGRLIFQTLSNAGTTVIVLSPNPGDEILVLSSKDKRSSVYFIFADVTNLRQVNLTLNYLAFDIGPIDLILNHQSISSWEDDEGRTDGAVGKSLSKELESLTSFCSMCLPFMEKAFVINAVSKVKFKLAIDRTANALGIPDSGDVVCEGYRVPSVRMQCLIPQVFPSTSMWFYIGNTDLIKTYPDYFQTSSKEISVIVENMMMKISEWFNFRST